MPVITSHARLAEQYGDYFTDRATAPAGQTHGGAITARDLVATVCNRILTDAPALVAEAAAGRADTAALERLIMLTTEQERERACLTGSDLVREVMDFLFGYGPLQTLIDDDSISDIDGTRHYEFTVKRNGVRETIRTSFPDARTYDTFCRLVIIRNGGLINENDSHCRVTDEQYRLRINVTVPPRSLTGPTISIRRHRRKPYRLAELTRAGMLDEENQSLIHQMAKQGKTVLFCGKGAAGKTTLLRAFIEAMPTLERVLIAESDSELYPEKPYCLMQRIKKPHEGGRPLALKDLIADGLTMSLDTYCIGEIVGAEAVEFIRAAYSGHRCLGTIHAESAGDAIDRLLSLARSASPDESEALLRRMLMRGIDHIVYLRDFKVVEIVSVNQRQAEEIAHELACIWPTDPDPSADTALDYPFEPLVSGT